LALSQAEKLIAAVGFPVKSVKSLYCDTIMSVMWISPEMGKSPQWPMIHQCSSHVSAKQMSTMGASWPRKVATLLTTSSPVCIPV